MCPHLIFEYLSIDPMKPESVKTVCRHFLQLKSFYLKFLAGAITTHGAHDAHEIWSDYAQSFAQTPCTPGFECAPLAVQYLQNGSTKSQFESSCIITE